MNEDETDSNNIIDSSCFQVLRNHFILMYTTAIHYSTLSIVGE